MFTLSNGVVTSGYSGQDLSRLSYQQYQSHLAFQNQPGSTPYASQTLNRSMTGIRVRKPTTLNALPRTQSQPTTVLVHVTLDVIINALLHGLCEPLLTLARCCGACLDD